MQHVAVRDNVSILALEDDLILTRNKLVVATEEPLFRVWLEDIRYLCARGENEAHATLEEDTLDDRVHLQGVCGEVQPGLHIIETIVAEERVDTEVTSVVGHLINYGASTTDAQQTEGAKSRTAGVGEMAEYIAIIQACHGEFRNNHLKEGGKGGKDAKLVRFKTKAGGSGEISAFHNPGRNKYFGMSCVDHLQTSRTLQVAYVVRGSVLSMICGPRKIQTVDDHNPPCGLFSGQTIEYVAHSFAKYHTIRIGLTS
jgi:2-phospho-L-lactate guanylyltransferase (CobY/MobA/RfbA family)